MKSILKRDLKRYFSKYNFFLIITSLIIIINAVLHNEEIGKSFNFYIGNFITYNSFQYISFSIIISCYFIWMSQFLFYEDIKNNSEFIFLRLSKRKWFMGKLLSIFLFNILTHLLYLLVFYIIVTIFKIDYPVLKIIYEFVIIILIRYLLQILTLIFNFVIGKYSFIVLLSFLVIPFSSINIPIEILKYVYYVDSTNYFEIILVILILMLICIKMGEEKINTEI